MPEPDFLSRTRGSYDVIADEYVEWIRDELAKKPLDRALLGHFAELVLAAGTGPVLDVGCGPGRIAGHLHDLGVAVSGIDLAPRMIAAARRDYPHLRFDEGSMTWLGVADDSVSGLVAWYSIIHVPEHLLPDVFVEFRRVLAPGGYLQLAFQIGAELSHHTEAAGHEIALDFHRRSLEQVSELLCAAGFSVCARTRREADTDGHFAENTPQGYLLARAPLTRA